MLWAWPAKSPPSGLQCCPRYHHANNKHPKRLLRRLLLTFGVLVVLAGLLNLLLPALRPPVERAARIPLPHGGDGPARDAAGGGLPSAAVGSGGGGDGGGSSIGSDAADAGVPPVGDVASPTRVGNRTYWPSFGIFPRGCKWRQVDVDPPPGAPAPASSVIQGVNDLQRAAATVRVEFWDARRGVWTRARPRACSLADLPEGVPPDWRFHNATPRTEVEVRKHHLIYRNLWYSGGRWYAVVDGDAFVPSFKWSKNHEVVTLHTQDAAQWATSVRWRPVRGDSLLFDFVYFLHPTAIGHWWEMLGPLFSVLKRITFQRPCDHVVLLHLRRSHLMEWVRALMAVALGVEEGGDLPWLLLQQESEQFEPFKQLSLPLEGTSPHEWLVFERVLVVRDLATGGMRTFQTGEDAREFRALMYSHHGLDPPLPRPTLPHAITFQRKRANRRVLNEDALLQLLGSYGTLRTVEFDATSSLRQQLLVMRDTVVFVSVHTSNLANSLFLQPGSAVVELIQRHWSTNGLDTSFRDQTARMGDIHHYAWRANRRNETVFLEPADERRFGNWTKSECMIEDCVEAATNVDVVVDLDALKRLLDSRLPLVFNGTSVKDAALPWPPALDVA